MSDEALRKIIRDLNNITPLKPCNFCPTRSCEKIASDAILKMMS